jgi:hypothetical protein
MYLWMARLLRYLSRCPLLLLRDMWRQHPERLLPLRYLRLSLPHLLLVPLLLLLKLKPLRKIRLLKR